MAAILDAARRGQTVQGGTLYSTTFPATTVPSTSSARGWNTSSTSPRTPRAWLRTSIPTPSRSTLLTRRLTESSSDHSSGSLPSPICRSSSTRRSARPTTGMPSNSSPAGPGPSSVIGWDVSYLEREDLTIVTLKTTLREQNVRLRRRRGATGPDAALTGRQAPGARIARPLICPAAVLRRSAMPAQTARPSSADSALKTAASSIGPSSCRSASSSVRRVSFGRHVSL